MRSRTSLFLGMLAIFVTFTGCHVGRLTIYDDDDRPRRVTHVHKVAHVCTLDCHRHYWNGVRLVALPEGHHHGADCGHRWNGTHWVVVGKARVRRVHPAPHKVRKVSHVHGPSCGCVYDRRAHKWLKLKTRGHVHRRGCGHVYLDGRWCLR